MVSLVLSTMLAVHKQSFLNLLTQNGRHVTEVYCLTLMTIVSARNRIEKEYYVV